MDAKVMVEAAAATSAIVVAALSYLFAKWKERDADWRKWKFDQYKELLDAMSGSLGRSSTLDGKMRFSKACNALNLIGSKGVLRALKSLIDATGAPNLSRDSHDALLSKLIWEIRQDANIPGTPDASEFSAHLWGPGSNPSER